MTGNEISVANEQQKAGLAQPAMGFSIVGIGASAGGIKALQSFFEALPSRTGLAFAVRPYRSRLLAVQKIHGAATDRAPPSTAL